MVCRPPRASPRERAVDDGARVGPVEPLAVGLARGAGQPRADERIRHGGGRVGAQDGAGRQHRQRLGQVPAAPIEQTGLVQHGLHARQVRLEVRVPAHGRAEVVHDDLDRLGLALQHAQQIERHDVAGALPDGVERQLAIEPRRQPLLDVAVAAEALHRLVGERRPDLAHPVLGDRGHQPAPGRGMRVGGPVEAAREPERQHRCRLHVERQVGQHLAHQRLVDEMLLEHRAVAAVMDGVGQRQAHQARRSRPRSRAACTSPSR